VTTAHAVQTTALLVGALSEQHELAALVHALGFVPLHISDSDAVPPAREPVALCLIDLRTSGDALRTVRVVRTQHPNAVIIGVADPHRPTASADAIRAGVFDVLPRPPAARDLETLFSNAQEQIALAAPAPLVRAQEATAYGLVGTSPAMRLVMDLVERAAAGRCGILICGERGTGREMIARAIHAHGLHRDAPFVKVDCSGPSPDELERQIFGVINKRTGTGAPERRSLERISRDSRLFDAAAGILFLENVTEMPARVQARLVRILRDREVFADAERLPLTLDVRPIAAVDASVEAALEEGRLRADLYERLALIRVDVPPLRMRREDIPVLATHFLKDICRANDKPLKTLTRSALTLLSALPWRGNAPELHGLLERLILLVPQGLIRLEDVLTHTQLEGTISPTGYDATLKQARARFERDYIAAVLQHQHGRIAEAARVLGIQRTNLYRKMRRLNLMRGKTSGREA
jgi:DNA-binding NtrC family response regulator